MSTLIDVDRGMGIAATIGDHLEAQVGTCPVSRIRLVTWVMGQFDDAQGLVDAEKNLPQLPSKVRMDYAAWIRTVA